MIISVALLPIILWPLGISLQHFEPFLPYISDMGVTAPAASLFTLMLIFAAILLLIFTTIRYEIIKENIISNNNLTDQTIRDLKSLNKHSLRTGICMSLGIIMVASFRASETLLVLTVHGISALINFIAFICDMYFQSRVANLMSDRRTGRLRLAMAIIVITMLIAVLGFAGWAAMVSPPELQEFMATENRLKWKSSQNGYAFHILSTVCEWILILTYCPYFWTFISQFKVYTINEKLG
ncbi:DNA damage-regulated autophagy modulator protein 1-like [Oppia nitens]|uniref:DNA damage-regulated autophagy modulator protein 1-like n=1 Tax=Oppia nitens TaxID=1686743 RepID=UPI0023D9C075|nr:DNA damage-regulated autophagy modulator protein 1-like [Oppia nitens]